MIEKRNVELLTSGRVAKAAGVNGETLRYYERHGLLPVPPRTASGYRCYPPDAVRRVRFIKKAQALGFSLREIKALLGLRADGGGKRCAEVRAKVQAKINEIDRKLKDLISMKRALATLEKACARRSSTGACPILDALEESKEEKR